MKVRQDYDGMKNQESRSQNEWDLCQQSSEPSLPLSTIDGQCIFEKKSKKCSTLSYCFFRIFIKKNREIFNSPRLWGLSFFIKKIYFLVNKNGTAVASTYTVASRYLQWCSVLTIYLHLVFILSKNPLRKTGKNSKNSSLFFKIWVHFFIFLYVVIKKCIF